MTSKDRTYILRTLFDRYGRKCYYCDKELPHSEITLDHIRPRKDRKVQDPRSPDCYVISCYLCNSIKADNSWDKDEFRKAIMGFSYYPINKKLTADEKKKERKAKRRAMWADQKKIIYPAQVLVTPAEQWIPPQRGVIHRMIWRLITKFITI